MRKVSDPNQFDMFPALAPDEVRRPRDAGTAATKTGRKAGAGKAGEKAEVAKAPRKGPGPSKLTYRLERAWAKPGTRNLVLVYLPLLALGLAGWWAAANDNLRGAVEDRAMQIAAAVAARPEFAVKGVEVTGGTDSLKAEVRKAAGVSPGMSSLTLEVADIRKRVEALGAVERASVQFDPQGSLKIAVVQRIAVALYRRPDGPLVLIDKGGVEIGAAGSRLDYPKLPVLLGKGAEQHVQQALALLDAAPEIVPRLRAVVRVGQRRWNLVLDRDMVVKLPSRDPVDALSRVMALHYGEHLLDRDLAVIDMRLPGRPALQMTARGAATYQKDEAASAHGGEKT